MQIKFSPILPQPLNVSGMLHELTQGMQDLGIEIRENFEDTTKTWKHKPVFYPPTTVPKVGRDMISVETTTTDQIYDYVSEGTPSHPIFPRNAKALNFPGTFIPKTFPGIIGSGAGFSGPSDQFRNWVAHPGIEPRKFDVAIKIRQERNAKIIMDRSIGLAAKASKHFIS